VGTRPLKVLPSLPRTFIVFFREYSADHVILVVAGISSFCVAYSIIHYLLLLRLHLTLQSCGKTPKFTLASAGRNSTRLPFTNLGVGVRLSANALQLPATT
jgi:hypothetical protein